ncbi:MAG: hypothetical protein ACRD5L_08085, partial [Bryobacteraceae bacterium]
MTVATTCGVQAEAKSIAVQPGKGVVIALLGDTILPEDWARLREEVASFYQVTRDKETIRLAMVRGSAVRFVGPFQTPTILRSALDEMAQPVPGTPGTIAPETFYTQVGALGSQFGSGWSAVILAGRFPDVPPDIFSYTQAWLGGRMRAARLRVYYWQISGASSSVMDTAVQTTGGLRLTSRLADGADVVAANLEFQEVSWQTPAVPAGFRLCASILGGAGGEMPPFATILAAAGAEPTIARYGVLREKIRAVADALRQPQLTEQQVSEADAALTAALAIDAREEEA